MVKINIFAEIETPDPSYFKNWIRILPKSPDPDLQPW